MSEIIGLKPTNILRHALTNPFTTRSDFARKNAEWVAYCCCEGLITTRVPVSGKEFGRIYYITPMGILRLRELLHEC
jgi:hypothetical protein